jgi:hypothetical protein
MTGEAAVNPAARGQALVAGDVVNTSARLQAAAVPSTVLVDEATRVAAGRAIVFEAAGDLALKGKTEPLKAWMALRVVAERGGAGRRDLLEPPFVGRDEELRLLKDSLHAIGRDGRSRLVTIIGQAGLGKSRLAWELRKYTDGLTESIYWHEGESPAYGEGVAYWALGEMVGARCRIELSDEPDVARSKLAGTLSEHVLDAGERTWVEPRLAALLGIAETPAGDREELFAAWRTFFERIADHGTVVLIFEDLHWADDGLLDFIDHLLDWSRDQPIFVIGLARPDLLERRPGWGSGHRAASTVHLEPLSDDAMGDMLRGLVPGLPEPVLRQTVERAEGVPLYAVETVRMLIDEGRLTLEGERYRLRDAAAPVAIPATLQALVTARLDSLASDERALLQDAAVLGKSFTTSALAAVSRLEAGVLDDLLRRLVQKEIVTIERRRVGAERGRHEFVQGLLREVAYSMLSRRDRRDRHIAAARHYESLADEELAGVVASHYLDAYRSEPEGPEAAATADQASVALRVAVERSVSLHANAAALAFVEQAIQVTREPSDRARLMVLAIEPAWAIGRQDLGERYAREAIAWYESEGRRVEAHSATATLSSMLVHLDRGEDIRALIEPILDEPDFERDPSAPRLLNELARAHMLDDRAEEALDLLERGLSIAERQVLELDVAELFATKAWVLGSHARFLEGVLLAEGSVRIAERIGASSTEARARLNLSDSLMLQEPARSMEVAGKGMQLSRRVGHAERAGALAGNLGYAALLVGAWDVPLANLAEMQETGGSSAWSRSGILGPAIVVQAFRGQVDEALEDEMMTLAPAIESQQGRAIALAQSAMVAYAKGELSAVEGLARAAHEESSSSSESAVATCLAARASTWLRDREAMRSVAGRLGSVRVRGEVVVLALRQLEAASMGLDGRQAEAATRYRENLAAWRRLGMLPDTATAEMEMLLLLDGLDDRAELAADAQRILEGLGAVTLLQRLATVSTPRGRVEVVG